MTSSPFYLCSGFHRSGTSLVALSMLKNGVDMGAELMGPSFSNANGHGEDARIVELHDLFLEANGTDWRYHGDDDLLLPNDGQQRLRDYLNSRRASSSYQSTEYGVKDPRAILFLDAWHEACEADIRFILVYRHWKFAVSSLLKRHSRILLQSTQQMSKRPEELDFWQYPDLAAKMWLCSAQKMLDCVQKYARKTLLFEQTAFTSENVRLCELAETKGVNGAVLGSSVYNPKLLQSNVPESMLDMISPALKERCDQVLVQLHNAADLHNTSDVNVRGQHPVTVRFNQQAQLIPAQTIETGFRLPDERRGKLDFKKHSTSDGISILKSLDRSLLSLVDWAYWLGVSDCTPTELIELFYLAVKAKATYQAEVFLMRATLMRDLYWQWTHLGDHYFRIGHFDRAEKSYHRAAASQPKHPGIIARLADIETVRGRFQQATDLLMSAESLDPDHQAIKDAKVRLERAQSAKPQAPPKAGSVTHLFTLMTDYAPVANAMIEDPELADRLDNYMVKSNFIIRDNIPWLSHGVSALLPGAKNCLLDYLFDHLERYWHRETLLVELAPQSITQADALNRLEASSTPFELSTSLKLGVHLHVSHIGLLVEYLAFVQAMPTDTKVIVTCLEGHSTTVKTLTQTFGNCSVVEVEDQGRDTAAWLMVAAPQLQDCDAVLKLHTLPTPEDPRLSGWRLQLLWSLLGDHFILELLLNAFESDEQLGIMLPPYHPVIAKLMNWGDNYRLASDVAMKFDLDTLDDEMVGDFPVGGMFWYRPSALKSLLEYDWRLSDFPEELGQGDGTIMNAIERLIVKFAAQNGFKHRFIDVFPRQKR